jgi:hypothetical protein
MSDIDSTLILKIAENAKNYDKDIIVMLYSNSIYNRIYIGEIAFEIESKKVLSDILLKLRSMEKHINWIVLIQKRALLKPKELFEWLFIENGDSITLIYGKDIHDDFITLVDIIRQYRIEKIFLRFDNEISMDIVRFISDVTKAYVYYQINGNFVHQNNFISFED